MNFLRIRTQYFIKSTVRRLHSFFEERKIINFLFKQIKNTEFLVLKLNFILQFRNAAYIFGGKEKTSYST